ncbi:MAG: type II secretion system protein [Alphaproteobacteria bacterium]|nr:type II secretion system protein [Alphaproteobacteria bacterium]
MKERGFTLVETLVAFAILAVVLVAFYEAMGTGFRTFEKAAQVEQAVLAAQSQLDRLVALRNIPDVRQGVIEGTALTWRLDVRRVRQAEGPSPVQGALFRLTVTSDAWRRNITLDRLVLVPRERSAT